LDVLLQLSVSVKADWVGRFQNLIEASSMLTSPKTTWTW
jgi:hypothetical protein